MKVKFCMTWVAVCIFASTVSWANEAPTADANIRPAVRASAKLPLSFEPAGTPGHFLARSSGYAMSIGATESFVAVTGAGSGSVPTLHFAFERSNAAASLEALEPLPGITNYYVGKNPKNWRLGVRNYAKLRAKDVYPGVDVVYYGDQRRLEFDFVVAPNANPGRIALTFSGMDKLYVDTDGDLVAEVNGRPVHLARPFAYQRIAGEQKPVSLAYTLVNKNQARLQIGDYDKNLELVIDPTLSYSTYLGGSQGDTANGIALDTSGNAYITGQTCSIGTDANPILFPAPNPNPSGTTVKGVSSACNAYVTKLNPAGTAIIFTTFISGSAPYPANAFATGNGIALDDTSLNPSPVPNGYPNVYMVGTTSFQDMPLVGLTPAGTDRASTYNGGDSDAFIAILDSTTGVLIRSSYLGGSLADAGYAIAVDPEQNVIVAGQTNSFNFPGYNGFEPITEAYVAFVTKLDFGLHIAAPIFYGASPMTPRAASLTDSCATATPCPAVADPTKAYYFFSAVYGGQLVAPPPTWNYTSTAGVPTGVITTITPFCPSVTPPVDYPSLRVVSVEAGDAAGINWGNCSSYQLGSGIPDLGGVQWEVIGVSPFPEPNYATTEAYGVALDPGGDVFLAGGSSTAELHPSLPGPAYAPGGFDWLGTPPWIADTHYLGTGAWIIKILGHDTSMGARDAGTPVYLTALGTEPTDITQAVNAARAIAVDSQGRAYVVGTAAGGIFTTTGSLNPSPIGGTDAFILRMNTAGSGVEYGTYLGGSGNDQGLAVAVNAGGWAYVAGSTQSTDIPALNQIVNASNNTLAQLSGKQDAYLAMMSPDGTDLNMSAYLGGSSDDQANAVALSKSGNGNIYLAGNTTSEDFPLSPLPTPATAVPGISAYAGNGDAFVTMILGSSFPTVSVTPTSLQFPNQVVGFSSSTTLPVTVQSTGQAILHFTGSITATGDFSQTNNCGTQLTPKGGTDDHCTITVTFTPSNVGTRSGVLTVVDDATDSPQTIGLQGTGVKVQESVSPGTLTFASQVLGTTSTAQTVTLTNTDSAQTLIVSSVVVCNTNNVCTATTDYNVSSNGCNQLLTPGKSCTIGVTFTPTAPGSRLATLMINGNGANFPASVQLTGTGNGSGSVGSPGGTGTATPTFTVTSTTTSLTVAQGQSGSLQLTLTPANGFTQTVALTCSVQAPATCSVSPTTATLPATTAPTVTVTIPAAPSQSQLQPRGANHAPAWPWGTLPFCVACIAVFGRRQLRLLLLSLTLCLALISVGCGAKVSSTSSTTLAPGTYNLMITATYTPSSSSGSSITQTLTVPLQVTSN